LRCGFSFTLFAIEILRPARPPDLAAALLSVFFAAVFVAVFFAAVFFVVLLVISLSPTRVTVERSLLRAHDKSHAL
jgi:uncharacterized protein (DUF58 family)